MTSHDIPHAATGDGKPMEAEAREVVMQIRDPHPPMGHDANEIVRLALMATRNAALEEACMAICPQCRNAIDIVDEGGDVVERDRFGHVQANDDMSDCDASAIHVLMVTP